ncbi:MAG TPA: DNA repair protein RecO [Ignavibacteriaceae bacterium]|nr:DNA repair protein RecO [Ignavibacteriaceae bacterium]
MSEIIKTEAVVLSKLNYGDTSLIVSLFTKELGKVSAIAKGARNSKAKIGAKVDPLNFLEIVFYNKTSRELQIISSADIIDHYPNLKKDFDRLKYAYSVLELIKKLTVEHEQNLKLFKGTTRIFSLMNESNESPDILFARFFLFLLDEIGYQVQIDRCISCGRKDLENMALSYNFEGGILCENCKRDYIESFEINSELFNALNGLKTNKNLDDIDSRIIAKAVAFMEKFLKYHVSDFQGIQSLQLFK